MSAGDARRRGDVRQVVILCSLLVEFVVLVLLIPVYFSGALGVPARLGVIGGVLPIAVPWGGALGGVSNAIAGQVFHWKPEAVRIAREPRISWTAWSLTQLPLGAAFGSVAALIVVLFLKTVGTSSTTSVNVSRTGAATLFVVGFIVGFQQDLFRTLVERVTTIVLGPGTSIPPAPALTFPSTILFPRVDDGATSHASFAVVNSSTVVLAVLDVVVADPWFRVVSAPRMIDAGASATFALAHTPRAGGSDSSSLSWTAGTRTYEVALAVDGPTSPAEALDTAASTTSTRPRRRRVGSTGR